MALQILRKTVLYVNTKCAQVFDIFDQTIKAMPEILPTQRDVPPVVLYDRP